MLLSVFDIRVMVASYNEFRSITSSVIFFNSLRRIGVNSFLNVWSSSPVKPFGPGHFLGGEFLNYSLSILVIGLFIFSISSHFSLGNCLCVCVCVCVCVCFVAHWVSFRQLFWIFCQVNHISLCHVTLIFHVPWHFRCIWSSKSLPTAFGRERRSINITMNFEAISDLLWVHLLFASCALLWQNS